eukprot:CAMPEP_0206056310 /NCGR_PEP_ID=MMETSP1466-20131121/41941_1 /ASSEMBLY_ACC=CAM_ASM_001126 /TAXON_ID=44452 /ORGANISM="Pavlova gyrans, Strain CCMP608" /LENGTH=63 /DNA_ID=CAMNT_0053431543 /DNA_START=14 /DNA_END=202 /DNA_ORIENTATION=+
MHGEHGVRRQAVGGSRVGAAARVPAVHVQLADYAQRPEAAVADPSRRERVGARRMELSGRRAG